MALPGLSDKELAYVLRAGLRPALSEFKPDLLAQWDQINIDEPLRRKPVKEDGHDGVAPVGQPTQPKGGDKPKENDVDINEIFYRPPTVRVRQSYMKKKELLKQISNFTGMYQFQCARVLDAVAVIAEQQIMKNKKFVVPRLCVLKPVVKPAVRAQKKLCFGKVVQIKKKNSMTVTKATPVWSFAKATATVERVD